MTQEDLIRLAREANLYFGDADMICEWLNELERFAALVAAAEREECAKVCEELRSNWNYCAAAIRGRK